LDFSDEVELEILKWFEYTKRKDYDQRKWFAFNVDTLVHPDFFGINGDEFKAYCWIISVAYKVGNPVIRLHIKHTSNLLHINEAAIKSCILKLSVKRWKLLAPIGSDRIRNASVTDPYPREEKRREEKIRKEKKRKDKKREEKKRECMSTASTAPHQMHELAVLWNIHVTNLSKVKLTSELRNKKISLVWKNHSVDEWIIILSKLNESNFCCGKNDRGWVATFDWLIKPDTSFRIFEGKYDNRGSVAQTFSKKREDSIDYLEEKWTKKEN
jgi:hypothetical protein